MSETPTGPVQPAEPERFADDARRYRLDSRIATGGMGEVWRGTDTALDRPVAIKLLKHEYADDATFRSRFETEARHAAALQHPGIAAVFDVGESQASGVADGSGIPRPFLVMELVDGQPLSALLRPGQPLDPAAVRDLLAQAGDAIGAAHRAGIVHRDIKPANLLVTPDRKIKITDFGIARASEGLGLTGTGQVMGTPQYLSPEQARGRGRHLRVRRLLARGRRLRVPGRPPPVRGRVAGRDRAGPHPAAGARPARLGARRPRRRRPPGARQGPDGAVHRRHGVRRRAARPGHRRHPGRGHAGSRVAPVPDSAATDPGRRSRTTSTTYDDDDERRRSAWPLVVLLLAAGRRRDRRRPAAHRRRRRPRGQHR